MRYYKVYEVINEMVKKINDDNEWHRLLIVGDYKRAYVMPLSNLYMLCDEFRDCSDELISDDKIINSIMSGETFGDYQEFTPFANTVKELSEYIDRMADNDVNPAEIWDDDTFKSMFRARINGGSADISNDLLAYLPSFRDFYEFMEELSNIYCD